MMQKLRIVSFICQPMGRNKHLLHNLMEKNGVILLQETLITDDNRYELDLIAEGNIAMSHTPAKQCTNLTGGTPSGVLPYFGGQLTT